VDVVYSQGKQSAKFGLLQNCTVTDWLCGKYNAMLKSAFDKIYIPSLVEESKFEFEFV